MSAMNWPHPPNECGDPSDCPQHAEMWWTYNGCTCTWSDKGEVVDFAPDCPGHGPVAS